MQTEMVDAAAGMFKQATETFQAAMQTGTKFQQEAVNAWMKPMMGNTLIDDIRTRGQKVAEASIKLMQQNLDDSQKLLDTQCRQSMDLLRKAFDASATTEKADLFETTRTLWQNTLESMRTSVEQIARTNASAVENWSKFMSTSFNGHADTRKPVAAAAK